ncbi:hypothetical protein OGAPHI_003753 [Ogataea philodendri]|uniref:MsrB domain-containing protein n=1 Tax=Ogataea philodendri TaxID=1378263 RepID=A0A9P8T4B3_9ASCO|nr:uncharacterized protein OGAPHI_003753 [Ogataea philodendri]KAH3665566.1 hypothetical protein OGAPHI_003753 [Ogataea philodendri]
MPKVQKSEEEWRAILNPAQFAVLRQKGTERPFTGEYTEFKGTGIYTCVACNAPLYESSTKFDSHCGWPSFYEAIPNSIITKEDYTHGMQRIEMMCANCGGHLGHIFKGEGYKTPTDARHCVNSICLKFNPDESNNRAFNVVDRHSNVVKSNCFIGILVKDVVALERGVRLGAVVVGELHDRLSGSLDQRVLFVFHVRLVVLVSEEIQCEVGGREVPCAKKFHSQHVLVELQGNLWILDSDHGVVQSVGNRINFRRLVQSVLDQLDPVSIWIKNERNVLLTSILELLLEINTFGQKILLGLGNVVHRNTQMAEPLVWLRIAVVHLGSGVLQLTKFNNSVSLGKWFPRMRMSSRIKRNKHRIVLRSLQLLHCLHGERVGVPLDRLGEIGDVQASMISKHYAGN